MAVEMAVEAARAEGPTDRGQVAMAAVTAAYLVVLSAKGRVGIAVDPRVGWLASEMVVGWVVAWPEEGWAAARAAEAKVRAAMEAAAVGAVGSEVRASLVCQVVALDKSADPRWNIRQTGSCGPYQSRRACTEYRSTTRCRR